MESLLLMRKKSEPPPETTMTYTEFLAKINTLGYQQLYPNFLYNAGSYVLMGPYLLAGSPQLLGSPWGTGRFAIVNEQAKQIFIRHAMPDVATAEDQLNLGKRMVIEIDDYAYEQLIGRTRNGGTSLGSVAIRANHCLSVIYHDEARMTSRIIRPYDPGDPKPEDYVFP